MAAKPADKTTGAAKTASSSTARPRSRTAAAKTATVETVAAAPSTPPAASGSYLEWGPVFGGAAIALALSMLLTQFGAGVGLSAAEEATLEGGGISWNVLVAGLWVILVALVSASAGGYVAGRMRTRFHDATEDESEFRDGTHGIVVWAVSSIVAMLALSVMTALASAGAAAEAEASATETTAEALRHAATVGVVFNFASAAGAALSAAAAWFAATTGGSHRDEGTVIHGVVPAYLRERFKRS
ncbi:hypothetical protein [Oricola cellulosilytica]|uniref:PhnA-like protein n=1 Tax=Oricola cellulosilytica TaxID=1429082 RepID=A0A4R0PDL7_9HYPH|nr:hypothetical protein [Oricola cellulosilytica]TCD14518.1 hypothetical protein E0D97_10710 [Oricola cellulosilytica]